MHVRSRISVTWKGRNDGASVTWEEAATGGVRTRGRSRVQARSNAITHNSQRACRFQSVHGGPRIVSPRGAAMRSRFKTEVGSGMTAGTGMGTQGHRDLGVGRGRPPTLRSTLRLRAALAGPDDVPVDVDLDLIAHDLVAGTDQAAHGHAQCVHVPAQAARRGGGGSGERDDAAAWALHRAARPHTRVTRTDQPRQVAVTQQNQIQVAVAVQRRQIPKRVVQSPTMRTCDAARASSARVAGAANGA